MFSGIKEMAVTAALRGLKEKVVNPGFEDIGIIRELYFREGKLYMTVLLAGLEDRPVDVCAKDIQIAPDGSSISIGAFECNLPCAENALNRFATRTFDIPAGGARLALTAVRKTLGL